MFLPFLRVRGLFEADALFVDITLRLLLITLLSSDSVDSFFFRTRRRCLGDSKATSSNMVLGRPPPCDDTALDALELVPPATLTDNLLKEADLLA
jgi:hypothetical protein